MNFKIVSELPSDFVDMAVEIRKALGLEPTQTDLVLYRLFEMIELSDELDIELIEFFRDFQPLELVIQGRMKWEEANGLLHYPVIVPPEFTALRQKLLEKLPPEQILSETEPEYFPQVTLGYIASLNRNQRDVVDNLFVPAKWTMQKVQLQSESKPGIWSLEAGYSLGN